LKRKSADVPSPHEKDGFVREGIARDGFLVDGECYDTLAMAIVPGGASLSASPGTHNRA
jgi:hypothetical protein